MKPDFALSLSFEGISLLLRDEEGWLRVGEAALNSADLGPELGALAETATQHRPGQVLSKVVIPPEQIRFQSIPDPDIDDPTDAIEASLDGATPYAVADLVYDWQRSGGMIRIAAVARETLDEAEGFASTYGFGPVNFAANPGEGFEREISFGETRAAQELIPGQTVEPDIAPINLIGNASDPMAEVPEEAEAETAGSEEPVAETERPEAIGGDEMADAPEDIEAPMAEDVAQDPEPQDDGAVPTPDSSEPAPEPHPATEPQDPVLSAEIPAPDAEATLPPPDQAPIEDVPPLDTAPQADAGETEEKAPGRFAIPFGRAARKAERDRKKAEKQESEKAAAPVMFGSRRGTRAEPQVSAPPPAAQPDTPEPEATAKTAGFASIRASRGSEAPAGQPPRLAGAERARPTAPAIPVPGHATAPKAEAVARIENTPEPPAFEAPPPVEPSATDAAPEASAAPERKRLSLKRKKKPAAAAPAPDAVERERQRMTVFGARKPAKVGGKPRFLGLMLTAVLLIFLAGVAAWASVYIEDGLARLFGRDAERTVASIDTGIDTPETANNVAPEVEVEVASIDPDTGADAVREAVGSALTQPEMPSYESDIDPEEVEARYAATGIWQMAPEEPGSPALVDIDDIYVASIDGTVDAHDAVALPTLAMLSTDVPLGSQRLPPAAGTKFKRDARGLIVATPEGIETPDGFTLYAGRPASVPPLRPASAAASALAQEQPEAVDPETLRLAGLKPKMRPTGLVEQNERANLGGRSRDELAGLRPKLRPRTEKQEAEEKVAEEPATAQAVATSKVPRSRPRNFARIVKRAQPKPDQSPSTATRVAQVKPKTVKPRVPSTATVARQATVKNAINLRKVNLIGVYGKPSSRRALVRLSSGRYKKVKVGDRIDGGRVAAIGEGELRYTKGGRSITLRMPRG